jgi:hypothetical protein
MQEMGDRRILRSIREGMPVVDADGDEVGTVDKVFLGDLSDEMIEDRGAGATSPAFDMAQRDDLIAVLADALMPNELPEELAERLMNNGYILMNVGLFRRDRFIMPDRIAGVYDGKVRLTVSRDQMR